MTRQRSSGYTLMELMVTVAIAGILTAVAVPSYRQYAMRAKRADATTALLRLAAQQEDPTQNSCRCDQRGVKSMGEHGCVRSKVCRWISRQNWASELAQPEHQARRERAQGRRQDAHLRREPARRCDEVAFVRADDDRLHAKQQQPEGVNGKCAECAGDRGDDEVAPRRIQPEQRAPHGVQRAAQPARARRVQRVAADDEDRGPGDVTREARGASSCPGPARCPTPRARR